MCVLSLAPAGEVQYRYDLRTACENNPDGFGYAIHTGRHILRRRSMDADYLIDRYLIDRAAHMDGPALFHARIATSGNVDNSGCHPFFVKESSKVAIGHNGVLPLDMTKLHPWKSDTRFFVEDIIQERGGVSALADPAFLCEVEQWMGTGNKMVILSADRRLAPYTILNEKSGHWEDSIWWSNWSYTWGAYSSSKSFTWKTAKVITLPDVTSSDGADLWEDDECPDCGNPLDAVSIEDGWCGDCGFDLLNREHVDSAFCDCYQCLQDQEDELSIALETQGNETLPFYVDEGSSP